MSARELQQTWAWSTSATTGGSTSAVDVHGNVCEWVCYVRTGPGCTATVDLQSADNSSGPWASEFSTVLGTSASVVKRGSGPFGWIRPYVTAKTTGALSFTIYGT